MTLRAARSPIFYGWYVLAAGFFALFVSVGARNGFGVFVEPMENSLDWSRTEISVAIAIGILVNGLSQPFLGRLYDRYGARIVISFSLLTLGLATVLLAFTSDFGMGFAFGLRVGEFFSIEITAGLLYLIVIYGLVMSTASSGASLVTVHAVLAKWFYRRRGIVLSISTAAMSVGGLILTPFAAVLIRWQDWRIAWLVLGALVLVLALPMMAFFMRDKPEDMGESPDGDRSAPAPSAGGSASPAPTRQRTAPLESENWRDSFKSPPIWQLSGAYFVCGVTTLIISTHYVPFAIEMGISDITAAFAFGFMQGLNVVGVLIVGVLADKFSRKNLLGTIYFIRFFAYVTLVAPGVLNSAFGMSVPPSIGIWCFAALAGMSWVATPPLTSSLTADIYGLRNLGTLGGFTTFAHQIGGSASVLVAGVLRDATGAYYIPFGLAGLTLLGATVASWAVKERKYSIRYQTAAPAAPAASASAAGAGD